MSTRPFQKPPLNIDDQIALLKQRGLTIADEHLAKHFLTHVGYYRLSGFWQFFQFNTITHTFIADTPFEAIIHLYDFDRELRLLVYDAIERVEIAFRSVMVNVMCMAHGSVWYTNAHLAEDEYNFNDNQNKIVEELNRSKEEFIKHHDNKYGKHMPPAWKTLQILSLGTLSKLYSNIKSALPEKNIIARTIGMPNYTYLVSWMQSLSVIRNYCAHHSRLCHRKYAFPPKKMLTSTHAWIIKIPLNSHQAETLYNQLCAIKFLMDRVSPGNHFAVKLKDLMAKYSSVNCKNMGFPDNWQNEQLWH